MKTKKRTFWVLISILLLINTVDAQWIWHTNRRYGKTEVPEWYSKMNGKIRKVAVLPFMGYSYQEEGLARRIESEIRSELISTNFFHIIEREYLAGIMREQHINTNSLGRNDVQIIKRYTGADLLIVGNINRYSQEEIFLEHVSGNYASGDRYKRIVSVSFSFRIINVANSDVVFEKTYDSERFSVGFKNVHQYRSSYNNNKSFGTNLLKALGEEIGSELEVSGQLSSYNSILEVCLKDIKEECYSDLVPLKKEFQDSWQFNQRRNKSRNYSETYLGKVVDNDYLNHISAAKR